MLINRDERLRNMGGDGQEQPNSKNMATEQKREGDWPLPPAKNNSFSRRALEFNLVFNDTR
jgi:hypothetical protein